MGWWELQLEVVQATNNLNFISNDIHLSYSALEKQANESLEYKVQWVQERETGTAPTL